jgi:hypothetical protein
MRSKKNYYQIIVQHAQPVLSKLVFETIQNNSSADKSDDSYAHQ